jgi:SAM-dependent methyltransferase
MSESSGGMGRVQRLVLRKFYANADGAPERLPWFRAEPEANLVAALESRGRPGRALDVGCGAGNFCVHLARRGWDVTGIDILPQAVAMARALSEKEKLRFEVLQTDILSYAPERLFDLVYDSGCLHCMNGGGFAAYVRQLPTWLAPGGDYLLGHFGKRHAFDWRPVGPRRRTEATIEGALAPEFTLVRKETDEMRVPLPIGPIVRGTSYWFRRRG